MSVQNEIHLQRLHEEVERLTAELRDQKETADNLIHQFDAAIRRIAGALTTKACGGVDTGDNINPETGEPYGHGGHTGWLLASEARKLREERDQWENRAGQYMEERDRYKADRDAAESRKAEAFRSLKNRTEQAESALLACQAREAELREALKEIRGVSCGEDNVPNVEIYRATDTDALAWVFHRAEQALSHSTGSKIMAVVEAAERVYLYGQIDWDEVPEDEYEEKEKEHRAILNAFNKAVRAMKEGK